MIPQARHVVVLGALAIAGVHVMAQAPQTTPAPAAATQANQPEIFLAQFSEEKGKAIRIAFASIMLPGTRGTRSLVNMTNNPGYDNQPHFLPDSRGVLFSSNRDGKQNDIYRYDFGTHTVTQVTNTAENEYSPTVTPDGRTFTTVRGAEQRLWRFNMDGSDAGLAYEFPGGLIGYHAWVSPTRIATFILGAKGSPNTLQLIDLPTGKADVIESNIGRSLLMRPGTGTVSFVHRPQGTPWTIKELDPGTRAVREIAPTVEGSEDMAWTPGGAIVMGQKTKLFAWEVGADRWVERADLAQHGIQSITRLAISPNGKNIAIVAQAAMKTTRN